MTEIVKGLFGFSPQELAMQRDQELTTKANAFAQLSPEQRATQMLYKGGNQLAGAVGGMLGAQDPQMKKSSDLQGIMQSGDFNTVEGATAMAQQAAAMGYGNEAQQMYAHAQSLRKSAADLGLTEARTQQALREKQGADPLQQLIRTGKYTPTSVEKYSKSGNVSDLDNVEKADQTALSETSEGIYLVNKTTGEKIARIGSAPDRRTSVNVRGDVQETQFDKSLGEGQAKDVLTSKVGAQDAATILRTNAVSKGLLKAGAITGTGADFLIGLNNALLQAGIETTSSDAAANSQAYVANMGANVGRIIKQFGAGTGLSDGDRKYAADIAAGRITLTQKAMERIIDINDRAATNVIKQHNKSVEGIKTNRPLTVEIPTTPLADKKARLAELEAKAKAGGGR
jgi:hypothetical protein